MCPVSPANRWPRDLTVALVSKWERALRRLERLPAATIAVADGDCGGPALDALLATDYRIASPAVRLIVPVGGRGCLAGHGPVTGSPGRRVNCAARRAVLFGSAHRGRRGAGGAPDR